MVTLIGFVVEFFMALSGLKTATFSRRLSPQQEEKRRLISGEGLTLTPEQERDFEKAKKRETEKWARVENERGSNGGQEGTGGISR